MLNYMRYDIQFRLSPEAVKEKKDKWIEIYGYADGYAEDLKHPDWQEVYNECIKIDGHTRESFTIVFAYDVNENLVLGGTLTKRNGKITYRG